MLPGAYLSDNHWYSWLRLSYEFFRTARASSFSRTLHPSSSSRGCFDRFSSGICTTGRGKVVFVLKHLTIKGQWGFVPGEMTMCLDSHNIAVKFLSPKLFLKKLAQTDFSTHINLKNSVQSAGPRFTQFLSFFIYIFK
jgi:hypothetical protein